MQNIALYTRVSTEDQAERDTLQYQRDFLRNYAGLYELPVFDEYSDPAVSGTIPFAKRPDGQRLLKDAEAGRFQTVVIYRIDRLARSLAVLTEAHAVLSSFGVTIRSATEPFDTSTPMGVFMLQLLGSMAELEKSTISERMTLGRDQVAKRGKWTGGPVPLGYDVDEDGCLIPSERMVAEAGMSECQLAIEIFTRLADGGTTLSLSRWLNASGVPTAHRYAGGKVRTKAAEWLPSRIRYMVRNTVYKGTHTYKSKHGPVVRDVPALIDAELWEAANQQMKNNRSLPKGNQKRVYLLRGLITCGECGCKFAGTPITGRNGWHANYYRCGSQVGALHPDKQTRCNAKMLHAERLEDLIWSECKSLINDQDAVEDLLDSLEIRKNKTPDDSAINKAIAGKARERDRAMRLFTRGRASLEDTERLLDEIDRETAGLRLQLSSIQSQKDVNAAHEAYINDWTRYREHLIGELADIERTDDREAKRRTIDKMVAGIRVDTEITGKRKTARLMVAFRLTSDPVTITWTNAGIDRRLWDGSSPRGEAEFEALMDHADNVSKSSRAYSLCRD